MAKRKPIVIKTPYPTLEETGKKFGISKKIIKRIKKLVYEIFEKSNEKSKKRKRKNVKGVNRKRNL